MSQRVDGRSPAWAWMGLELLSAREGEAVVEMPTRAEMGNHQGTVHGGFISFLADSAMGRSLATVLPEGERHFSFDLKLSFLSPAATGEPLRAVARVIHAGRRTGVTECRIEGPGRRLVATATASFSIRVPEEERRD